MSERNPNMSTEEFRNHWCEALRSGKYKQGKKVLHNRDTDTFCCLGVACEVYNELVAALDIKDGIVKPYTEETINVTRYNDAGITLPFEVAGLLNMSVDGTYDVDDKYGSLVSQNDRFSKSFSEIADLIETKQFVK